MTSRKRPERALYTPPQRRSTESLEQSRPENDIDEKEQKKSDSQDSNAKIKTTLIKKSRVPVPEKEIPLQERGEERIVHAWELPDASPTPAKDNNATHAWETSNESDSHHSRRRQGRSRQNSSQKYENGHGRTRSGQETSPRRRNASQDKSKHKNGRASTSSSPKPGSGGIKFSLSYTKNKDSNPSHDRVPLATRENGIGHGHERIQSQPEYSSSYSSSAEKNDFIHSKKNEGFSEKHSPEVVTQEPGQSQKIDFNLFDKKLIDSLQGISWAEMDD